MIVVITEMPVFVSNLAFVESVFLSESETAHHAEGISNEIRIIRIPFIREELHQLSVGDVALRSKKSLQDSVSILKRIDMFLFKQFLKLLLFLAVDRFHIKPFDASNDYPYHHDGNSTHAACSLKDMADSHPVTFSIIVGGIIRPGPGFRTWCTNRRNSSVSVPLGLMLLRLRRSCNSWLRS